MQDLGVFPSRYGLETHGIKNADVVFWNLGSAELVEHAVKQKEGVLASSGALVVRTGERTGRSPRDKFVVCDESVKDTIWWGTVNRPIAPEKFDALYNRILSYLQHKRLYVQDCFVGADERYRVPIRVITQFAWHSLFARQLFIRPDWRETGEHRPEFVVLAASLFRAEPQVDGTHSDAFILVNFAKRVILIGGTAYAGEIKKSIFTVMNYLMPQRGVLPMHCAANVGEKGDVALFFGLSGTGKTSLSADPERFLIGDDEHGWSEDGIFNFEGGCYAKCIRLSKENEPQIWNAIRFGAIVENAIIDENTRVIDFNDDSITENTRAGYPLDFIDNAVIPSIAGHPKNVFFLTCDAFGVLPPIARLTEEQAEHLFLLGYTAKVAGTETGIIEPQVTFSTCFGAPFLPLPPSVYANMLSQRLRNHRSQVWLVNTGWTGGPYGVGHRISIPYTRAMIRAALTDKLHDVEYRRDSTFGLYVPKACPGVPSEILEPRQTWEDKEAYDRQAQRLAAMWDEGMRRT